MGIHPYSRLNLPFNGQDVRLLIADDHPLFRQGLKQALHLQPKLKVVAEASSGEEAIAHAAALRPDVALLDIDMPDGDGFATARKLICENWISHVVFLTLYKDAMHLDEALDIGASGYIVKDCAAADVVQCIRAVLSGARYVSPILSTHLVQGRSANSKRNMAQQAGDDLTAAERRVLLRLAEFKTNKQIATELGISIRTVETHRANLCEKLGLRGSHALVRFALANAH